MADVSKLEIESGTYDIKDSVARNEILYKLKTVKDFGCVGDGITDDTSALQKAIDSQKVVIFNEGTYNISQVFLKTGTTIIGNKATIKGISEMNTEIIKALNISNVIIDNLIIDCNYVINGIGMYNVSNGTVKHCDISHAKDYNAIQTQTGKNLQYINNVVHDNPSGDCIAITAGTNCLIEGNYCYNFKDTGIVVTQSYQVTVANNIINNVNYEQQPGSQGIAVSHSINSIIDNNNVKISKSTSNISAFRMYEAETITGLYNNNNNIISNNFFSGTYSFVADGNDHIVTNNIFDGNEISLYIETSKSNYSNNRIYASKLLIDSTNNSDNIFHNNILGEISEKTLERAFLFINSSYNIIYDNIIERDITFTNEFLTQVNSIGNTIGNTYNLNK